jgi:hypothetical protein
MERKNCWEVNRCGREPDGRNWIEFGVCPAALPNEYEGTNNGKQGVRICWAVAGTFCKNKITGTFAPTLASCLDCKFLHRIRKEEGGRFSLIPRKVEHLSKLEVALYTHIFHTLFD